MDIVRENSPLMSHVSAPLVSSALNAFLAYYFPGCKQTALEDRDNVSSQNKRQICLVLKDIVSSTGGKDKYVYCPL